MQGQDEELVNTGGKRGGKSSYFSVCKVDFCMSTAQDFPAKGGEVSL